ncbi:MAG: hypothetical protein WCR07_09175, partial [Verrucomicrobiota bacterium]
MNILLLICLIELSALNLVLARRLNGLRLWVDPGHPARLHSQKRPRRSRDAGVGNGLAGRIFPSVVSHKWLVFRREGFSC